MRVFVFTILLFYSLGMPISAINVNFKNEKPFLGAQIFIEPGQTQEQIEDWFKTMKDNGMNVCRIRMFESYILQKDGYWDFTLFDYAFKAAEKYGIQVYATLFPATEKTDIGGWKFPKDNEQKERFKIYIKNLVMHYKDCPSLLGWVILNEPGLGGKYPKTPFLQSARVAWDLKNPVQEYKDNGYPILMTTHNQKFLNDYTSEFLNWIASEIKKYDSSHDIHVNPAAVFNNYGDYDFPTWRQFLTSLGGSAHPSWHFGYFERQQYGFAMLALSEMIRSGAGNMPWFMTEIQGGNNTYSGGNAICPTPEEIMQWLWIIIGCEGKGGIFWMLNPRSSGIEAGEWAMVDFQGKASDRLKAVKEVSDIINNNESLFSKPRLIESGIDVVYLKETLWAENLMGKNNDLYLGRRHGAVIKSPLACFKALTERGLNVGLKEFNEYDFTKEDYSGHSIIISNQISVPNHYLKYLEHFVSRGGTLFVEGLTAFFDEDLHNTMNTSFTFESLFGGNISEFILKDNLFTIENINKELPIHLWQGKISNTKDSVIENTYGKGKVIWFPSNIALGAWVSGNYKPLSDYLYTILPQQENVLAFDKYYENVLLRTLETHEGKLLICINKSSQKENVTLINIKDNEHFIPIYKSKGCLMKANHLTLEPEGIMILKLL